MSEGEEEINRAGEHCCGEPRADGSDDFTATAGVAFLSLGFWGEGDSFFIDFLSPFSGINLNAAVNEEKSLRKRSPPSY